ncbi:aminotransferase class I/II-fold pyridoxal phosphate-dependent enzyme [Streptomyces sp. NPDC002540]
MRTAIADTHEAQGLATDSGHLLLTSGADAALSLLSAAYLRPNSRVVLDSPCWSPSPSPPPAGTSPPWIVPSRLPGRA